MTAETVILTDESSEEENCLQNGRETNEGAQFLVSHLTVIYLTIFHEFQHPSFSRTRRRNKWKMLRKLFSVCSLPTDNITPVFYYIWGSYNIFPPTLWGPNGMFAPFPAISIGFRTLQVNLMLSNDNCEQVLLQKDRLQCDVCSFL